MREGEIVKLIQARAHRYAQLARLEVDYYRIRRKIAFPWPMSALPRVEFAVQLDGYPWHTWLSWAVEERINAIGWAAEISADETLRQQCRDDLLSLARWPAHTSTEAPDLTLGHLLRTMVVARRNWNWLGDELNHQIAKACAAAVEQKKKWIEDHVSALQEAGDVIKLPPDRQQQAIQNIPVIGACGLAMAVDAAHPLADALSRYVEAVLSARLTLLDQGVTEAVAYDGYVLDFAADWIAVLPAARRVDLLEHPGLLRTLQLGIDLAAPGDVMNVANLSDVEAREMPFHASAHAKFARMRSMPASLWYLQAARADWLRSDALAAMHCLTDHGSAPSCDGAAIGPYAVTLRSGWEADDLTVAISAARSPMPHVHFDAGSIVIGQRGRWLISDPGYQQYLQKREREFTMGPLAHNAPRINDLAQTAKAAKIVAAGHDGDGVKRAVLDLTACYEPAAGCTLARRSVWLLPGKIIVLCDEVKGPGVKHVSYAWHDDPAAGWWAEGGRAILQHEATPLWIACSAMDLLQKQIDRLPGSRGHLSLVVQIETRPKSPSAYWWIFNTGAAPVSFTVEERQLTIGATTLKLTLS